MNPLRGMMWLLIFQSAGELLGRGLALPLPGPVIGMVLLLLALRWPAIQEPVGACAEFLLSHLSLLFVPVGVGVMTHLSLVSQYGIRMLAVVVLSTVAGLAVTVLTLHLLRDRGHGPTAITASAKDGDV
ncbi:MULTISPECIES: CidA/LrgA family protein [unclassified Polaromonas]|uniref:CidA/LrgA family protein n=1 Tax=unclassified Polaromonas TaxID=2638319 RepID=UPI0018C93566|nr:MULTISPECIES: CidA/LrgA family protein [unclassified Polaromonas]MBG6072309.1 holin-like protein [Polaromonas sp. CG_9.7]MBG6114260.1 holin-like protein [Polaromonas sp. CG_9.2]MDH6182782.1 holin-like protein [Polaromonas sp. CG_23.6]